jgi:hypothetical protein
MINKKRQFDWAGISFFFLLTPLLASAVAGSLFVVAFILFGPFDQWTAVGVFVVPFLIVLMGSVYAFGANRSFYKGGKSPRTEDEWVVWSVRKVLDDFNKRSKEGRWDKDTHVAARILLNKVGYTEEHAKEVDPRGMMKAMLENSLIEQGVTFTKEVPFERWLESFRAFALLEQTLHDTTPIQERIDALSLSDARTVLSEKEKEELLGLAKEVSKRGK